MADWLKVYETDLDDDNLQWAMSEQPVTAIVYFALLIRCCKEKSGSIKWSKDHELFALTQKVHSTVGYVNQAISLLERIDFIQIKEGFLTVNSWKPRQSDYCNRLDRTMSEQSRTLTVQRRGEEKRGVKRRKTPSLSSHMKPLAGENCFLKTGEMPHEFQ